MRAREKTRAARRLAEQRQSSPVSLTPTSMSLSELDNLLGDLPSLDLLLQEKARRETDREAAQKLTPEIRASIERRALLHESLGGPHAGLARPVPIAPTVYKGVQYYSDEYRTAAQNAELAHCADDVVYWFNNWVWTYDPRVVTASKSAWFPFDLYPRQVDFVSWMLARIDAREECLCEKSRGVGFTWLAGGIAVHKWRFAPGFKTTFGSRVEEMVDKIGDPDSIFEKIRLLIYRLPAWMRPIGFNKSIHDNFMRIVNPENSNIIGGAAGEDMGRGGRSTWFVVDEGAFVKQAERVEAAISENADCRLWASTVNGHGNLFAKKRFGGGLDDRQIFRFHWRDDPRRDDAWATKKKKSLAATPHLWFSEFEIDYSASVEGLCIPAAWIDAACRLATIYPVREIGPRVGGLDIGAGRAKSVFLWRAGPAVSMLIYTRKDPDTTDTAFWAIECGKEENISTLKYDSVGVGIGVTSTFSKEINKEPTETSPKLPFEIIAMNAGDSPSEALWEDGKKSSDKFANIKAEAWWVMRERFKCSFEHCNYLDAVKNAFGTYDVIVGPDFEAGEGAVRHELDDMIAINSMHADLRMQLSLPKWFRNEKGRIILESKMQLAARGIASPDLADALALTFMPESTMKQAGFFAMIQAANARFAAEAKADAERMAGRYLP